MGFKDWLGRTFGGGAATGGKSYMMVVAPEGDGFMKSVAFNDTDLQKAYVQTIWTYICASRISQDMGSLPAVVETLNPKTREWEHDLSHELNAVIARPYGQGESVPPWNWQQMVTAGQLRQELCGNQFLRKVVSGSLAGSGKILALQLILQRVEGITDERGVPTRYKIGQSGDTAQARDLVNVMHGNPDSWWDGVSPLVAAQLAIHMDYSISQRIQFDLEHRVAPGVVFKVKALFNMNKTQREVEEAWLSEQFGKAASAGKSMVIGDNVEVSAPPLRQLDDLPAHAAAARDAIISAFDVSPPVVGVLRDVKYQTWDQALRAQWTLCIEPRARNFYTTINTQAIWPVYGPTVRIWYDPIQSPLGLASVRERAETAEKYFKFGYPANAINAKFHLGMPYFKELERPNMPSVIAGREDERAPAPAESDDEVVDDDENVEG